MPANGYNPGIRTAWVSHMRQTRLSHRSAKQDEAIAPPSRPKATPDAYGDMMSLQSTIGNAAIGSLVRSREAAMHEAPTPIDAFTQGLIEKQSGSEVVSASGGPRIHHGPESDMLSRMLGARGFTQGNDVFLRSDRDPASDAGRATLAHEMTHIAQGSIGRGAVLRDSGNETTDDADALKAKSVVVAKITFDDGEIKGESKVPGHVGEIEFDSVGFGSASGTIGRGGGSEAPKEKTTELQCSKKVDSATAELFRAMVDGKHIKSAVFVFIKPGTDGSSQEYMTLTFTDGIITSDQPSQDREAISFQFKGGP